MKKSEIKTIWKVAKCTWIGSFVFWIVETLLFMIIEGWHYKATNPTEIYCDKIVTNMWTVAIWLTTFCAFFLIANLKTKSK